MTGLSPITPPSWSPWRKQPIPASPPTITGGGTNTAITDADAKTNADSLVQSIFDAAESLDGNDVPDEDRYVFVLPEQYYLLVNSSSKAINTDYNPGANGSISTGKVYRVAGMEIVKTNNLPQSRTSPRALRPIRATSPRSRLWRCTRARASP